MPAGFSAITTRILLLCALFAAPPAAAQHETVWSALIPQGFPGRVYTWHLKPDGRYSEDGRDLKTGSSIQSTLSGHWTLSDGHMRLQQDGIAFVFEGEMIDGTYQGSLYLGGRFFSHFCAVKGQVPPANCDLLS